eukprot:4597982-Karenia_brevis.AAC.1
MISDVSRYSEECGLVLHPDKSKILTNATRARGRQGKHAIVGHMNIEVLDLSSGTKYLGRQITFDNPHETELDHRIKQAWR